MLTSFGIFWGAEGAGAMWPSADAYLLWIIPFVTVVSLAMVQLLKARRARKPEKVTVVSSADLDSKLILDDGGFVRAIKDFGYFWYDFLIGDDLIGFAIVVLALQGTHMLVNAGTNAWWLLPLAVVALLPINLFRVTR
jgi:hypothetical protein